MPVAPRGPSISPRVLQEIAAQQQMKRRGPMLPRQGVPMPPPGAQMPTDRPPGMKKGGVAKKGKTKGKVI